MKIDLIIAGRRLRNRILDLAGRLLGYCMADTWQDETDDHGPRYAGYAHWRCWHTRRQHRNMHGPNYWHRFRSYRWRPGGTTEYHPLRTVSGEVAGYGSPPAWARRFPHVMVPTRRRERLVTEYAERQAAARRAQRVAAERAGRSPIMCVHGVAARDCSICSPPRPRVGEVVDYGGGWRWQRTPDGGWQSPPADDLMNLADAVAGEWTTEIPVEFKPGGVVLPPHMVWLPGDTMPPIPTQRKDEPQ